MEESRTTSGVNILTGDPKKALIAMMVPVTIALFIQSINSIINSIWVSGLGPAALAATGVIFPLYFIMIAIGSGIGVGASRSIARRIGSKDHAGADNAAMHAIILTVICGIISVVVIMLFLEPFISAVGGKDILKECLDYAYPMIIGSPIIMMSSLMSSILRSEGAAKRSMMIQVAAALINLVLDPIFIYTFGMGISGASVAMILAMGITLLPCIYWFKIKRDTYLRLSKKNYAFSTGILKDISSVGFPAALEMLLISVISMVMNIIIYSVGQTNGVAVYSTGWRVINMIMIPMMAMGQAIVPVCAANYGARKYANIKIAYNYSIKITVALMVLLTALTVVTAPMLVFMFTYSDHAAVLREDMIYMVRVASLFLPFAGWGFVTSGFFQSLGMGMKSLMSAVFRNVLRVPICLYIATFGVLGNLWWGLTVSEIIGSLFIGIWGYAVLRVMMKSRAAQPIASEEQE